MDPLTYMCQEKCPLTLSLDENTGICSVQSPAMEYAFDTDLEPPDFTSLIWPSLHNNRGAYFNGRAYLEWTEFIPHGKLFLEVWFRPDGVDRGMLVHFDFVGVPVDPKDRGSESKHDEWWWMYDSCLNFGSEPVITWHSLAFRLTFGENVYDTSEEVSLDGRQIYASSDFLGSAFYMSPVEHGSFWIGSYRGS